MAQTISGVAKIYPAKEMRAVDMAEALKALTLFNGVRRVGNTDISVNGGIIQGCSFAIPTDRTTALRMSAGRILICGRLADFTPESGNYFYFSAPSVPSDVTCVIAAVCDLSNPTNPFYITLATSSTLASLDAAANRTTDEMFNRNNGLRYLRLGTVKVKTNGVFTDYTPNPYSSEIKSNKALFDEVKNNLETSITNNNAKATEWINYLKTARFNSDFFTAYRISADGVVVDHNSTTTFRFRSEYGSQVIIQPTSGSGDSTDIDNVLPEGTFAVVVINKKGGILAERSDTTPHSTPSLGPNGAPTDIIRNPYVWKFLGINEIHIENATTNGSGSANCVIQSYFSESAPGGGHVCVTVKNLGNTNATIKLTVRSLYVANIGGAV